MLSRNPTQDELEVLVADLNLYLKDFKKRPDAAKKLLTVGEKKADAKLPAIELAAYALVANTIFNLDEAITQN